MNVPDFLLVLLKFLTDKKSAVNVKIILSRKTAVVISKFILSE